MDEVKSKVGRKPGRRPADNMEIWNKVNLTDPEFAQPFERGDFKGTAICAQSQIMKATEMFGPIGVGWGYRNENFRVIEFPDRPYLNIMQYTAEFWYKKTSMSKEAIFPMSSDIQLYVVVEGRMWAVYDPTKKVVTDALTKAFSKLGFNADVFLNRFEDNKYVKDENNKLVDIREVIQEATKLKEMPEKHFHAALARINKGEDDLYDTVCQMYDLTQLQQSVLFEASKKVKAEKESNGTILKSV